MHKPVTCLLCARRKWLLSGYQRVGPINFADVEAKREQLEKESPPKRKKVSTKSASVKNKRARTMMPSSESK